MSDFPSPFYAQLMYNYSFAKSTNKLWRNLTDYDTLRKSVIALEIYYGDIAVTTISESPAKTPQDFVADLVCFER
jgi:hypothetical protein